MNRQENIDVHTCTPESTTPVGGTVEGEKFLVFVTCKCGKHFNIPYQQGFTIDLRGDFFVKCACGCSYNLFDEGKKALERQGVTLPIAGKKFTRLEIDDWFGSQGYFNGDWEEGILRFLKDHDMLSD